MQTIAIANHKGGVGKTTTAVNLAAALARRGHRTLLVDVDAQAHATFWFVDDPEDIDYDLHDVITAGVDIFKAIRPTRIDDLDLLPATLAIARLELDLVQMVRREDRIDRALSLVSENYDYAVIDLAPSLSVVTLAALTAADFIVTPVSATKLAMGGLGAFLGWTDEMREAGAMTAPLLGVLVTMFDKRSRIGREVLTALTDAGMPRFETVIPRRAAAEDHVGGRLVTGDPEANEELSAAYGAFADELIAQTGANRG